MKDKKIWETSEFLRFSKGIRCRDKVFHTLSTEIKKWQKDPEFRKAAREFIRSTS